MTRARLGALLALTIAALPLWVWLPSAIAQEDQSPFPRGVLVVLVPDISFEELMAYPEMRALAASGGAGVYNAPSDLERSLTGGFRSGVLPLPTGVLDERLTIVKQGFGPDPSPISELGEQVRAKAEQFSVDELLVIVAGISRSSEMRSEKDELLPIIVGRGNPSDLFASGSPGSLTSDSTRRNGVVTQDDVVPTILRFHEGHVPGHPNPDATNGSPIEFTGGPPPFELHERYLAQRGMYVPIGTAGGIYLAIAGLGGIAALALGSRVPIAVGRIFGWGCLSVAALATAFLAAGHLPDLSYATVVPFVALVTVFGTLAFAPLERRDVLLIPAGIGIAVLTFFAVEATLVWAAALTPFVGGSELDGGRFYGLPNVFIGLLIGACLWIAQRLRTAAGFALLVVVAIFAGFPYLGANLGGGVSLFAAAGLWLAIRERERLGVWKGLGVFVGVTLLGTALILVAHAVSPFETHVTKFEEQAGGLGGVLEKVWDRLQVGFDLIARNPFALIPVLGLPIAIAAVLRPPAALRPSLERSPAWRDAILVTLLAGVVAYVVNDSGPAAAGFAFGLGLGGLLGVSLLSEAGKMGEP